MISGQIRAFAMLFVFNFILKSIDCKEVNSK